jgi:hypothetical protein
MVQSAEIRLSIMEAIMFGTNVGTADRAMRVILGVILLALFFLYPGAWWRYWTLLGIPLVATGLIGTCPAYSMIGMSTCATRKP